jgi:hypothetical protein
MPLYRSIEDCIERNRRIQDCDVLIASQIWYIWELRRLGILAEEEGGAKWIEKGSPRKRKRINETASVKAGFLSYVGVD